MSTGTALRILTSDQVRALRAAYADTSPQMIAGARASLVGPFSGAGPMVEAMVQTIYGEDARGGTLGLPASDRERSLITLLAASGSELELAIHFYWGLAEGLNVADMADVLVLVGSYSGVSRYNGAMGVLRKTLGALAGLFAVETPVVSAGACVGAIAAAFNPPPPKPSESAPQATPA